MTLIISLKIMGSKLILCISKVSQLCYSTLSLPGLEKKISSITGKNYLNYFVRDLVQTIGSCMFD